VTAAGRRATMAGNQSNDDDDDITVKVLVEIPKGSRNKYEYDQESDCIELDRRLFAAVSYPTEYGFVKHTRTEEGEELDALVAVTEPTFPGCVVPARPIAVLRMFDGDTPDHKVLTVPVSDPAWNNLGGAEDLPGELAEEIEHFFNVYTDLEGKDWRIDGWGGRDEAIEVIKDARERYQQSDDE
jgi:inorganic pyrophosphatase